MAAFAILLSLWVLVTSLNRGQSLSAIIATLVIVVVATILIMAGVL